jgi:aspartate aminotransferase-like enzyme
MPHENCRAVTVDGLHGTEGYQMKHFATKLWKKYGIMIGGSWGSLAGKVWRIGTWEKGAKADKFISFL